MSEFTRAPWVIRGDITDAQNGDIAITTERGTLIALAYKCNAVAHNANLISSAPDMHKALEFVKGFIEDYFMGDEDSGEPQKTLRVVKKALKKARGE